MTERGFKTHGWTEGELFFFVGLVRDYVLDCFELNRYTITSDTYSKDKFKFLASRHECVFKDYEKAAEYKERLTCIENDRIDEKIKSLKEEVKKLENSKSK